MTSPDDRDQPVGEGEGDGVGAGAGADMKGLQVCGAVCQMLARVGVLLGWFGGFTRSHEAGAAVSPHFPPALPRLWFGRSSGAFLRCGSCVQLEMEASLC